MNITHHTTAPDFNAFTSERAPFTLSRFKGSKIILSFFRNSNCAVSNYRLSMLKKQSAEFAKRNVYCVTVFESMPANTLAAAGRSAFPFYILADPMGILYELYGVQTAEQQIRDQLISGTYNKAVDEAAKQGFSFQPQPGSNFFRLPAEFLVDENFSVNKAHYLKTVGDWLPMYLINNWVKGQLFFPEKIDAFSSMFNGN